MCRCLQISGNCLDIFGVCVGMLGEHCYTHVERYDENLSSRLIWWDVFSFWAGYSCIKIKRKEIMRIWYFEVYRYQQNMNKLLISHGSLVEICDGKDWLCCLNMRLLLRGRWLVIVIWSEWHNTASCNNRLYQNKPRNQKI